MQWPIVAIVGLIIGKLISGDCLADGKNSQFREIVVDDVVRSMTLRAVPWGALTVSLIFHLTGMGVTSLIVYSSKGADTESQVIEAEVDPVISGSSSEMELLTAGAWSTEPAGGGFPHPAGVTVESELKEPTLGISSHGLGGVFSGIGSDYSFIEEIGDGGTGGGSGGGHGTGHGPGTGDGFFGLDLSGERIVFVVDASRSMNYPYPGEAKNRLGRVKIELYNTLRKMTPQQSFYVIYFNTEPIPMPSPQMVKADPNLVKPFLSWIFSARGIGQTNPESALLMALRLQPDKVYFLTDGDFSYRSVRSVREANRNRIPIHTIGFGGQEGERNLLEIANDSRGTYQYIPEPTKLPEPTDPIHAAAPAPAAAATLAAP